MGKFIDFLEAAGSPIASIIQSVVNASMQHATNKHNERLVDKQNAAAALEAEKAYRRSLPTQQIANMRAAGISDFASAQAISGGGTYNPAPVNTAKAEAPQIDLSSAMESVLNAQRLKQEERMQNKLLKHQAEENAANRETQLQIAQMNADTSNYSTDKNFESNQNRLEFEKKMYDEMSEYQKREYNARIKNIEANTELTQEQKNDLKFRVLEYQSSEQTAARKAKALFEAMEADLGYRINQYEFDRFVNKYYTRNEQGELVPKEWIGNAEEVQEGARLIWDTIFEIVPLRVISELLGFSGEQASTAATLARLL